MLRPSLGILTPIYDDQRWDEAVNRSDNGEIFHTSVWLSLLSSVYGVRVLRLAQVRHGVIVGGLPVLLRKIGPLRVAGSPFSNVATPQMGPFLTEHADLDLLLHGYDEVQSLLRIAFAEIVPPPQVDDHLLQRYGYQVVAYTTLVLDLQNKTSADLWKGFEGRSRTAVRKAEREGVHVEAVESSEWLAPYWEMVTSVFARQSRRPPIPRPFYENLWLQLSPTGCVRVYLATYESRVIAGAIFLHHRDTLYYFDGASFAETNNLGANNLIQWHVLQWAVDARLATYDMVGAGVPAIAKFKASFGSKPVESPLARRTNSLVARAGLSLILRYRLRGRRLLFRAGSIVHRPGGNRTAVEVNAKG